MYPKNPILFPPMVEFMLRKFGKFHFLKVSSFN
jgi:hypothetical protein